ncbi:MAG: vWA domain-containing protein [Sulfitobacter sp.]
MSDPLDDLEQMMQQATPAPDPKRRVENIALAQKNFAALQGSASAPRPTSKRPIKGLWIGATTMFKKLTSPAALTGTTALVAVGAVLFTPLGDQWRSDAPLAVAPAPELSGDYAPEPQITAELSKPAPKQQKRVILHDTPLRADQDDFIVAVPADTAQDMQIASAPPLPAPDFALPPNTEEFANFEPNPLKITSENPVSTFSIDVDTASYGVIRNSLNFGQLPPKDAVRIEEMVNYFPYDYPAPSDGAAFKPSVSVSQTPWNPGTKLVHIGIQGTLPDVENRPPLNLVFLVDTSGSMSDANKLPLLKQSLTLMLGQLRPEDQVAIVEYAGSAGQALPPTSASDRAAITTALGTLGAGGATAGQEGLEQAYALAASMSAPGEVSRVLLATDGDFNVGLSNPDALKDYISDKRETGIYLSVLGFGRGNLSDATMQALAQNGNGTAAYIDTLSEAQKVLVDQLSGALFPIADDAKIQVEFNPAHVSEYRLIGYETRILNREDFNNDRVDAGDIGAGHQVTALYEITPSGSPAQLSDPLRYGTDKTPSTSDELGFLRLRSKAPGATQSTLIEMPITADLPALPDAGFAAAIAGFGQLLRGSDYLQNWSYGDAIALAAQTKGPDPYGYRAEAIQLMRLAQSLSQ